jgi:hypothetical protein
MMLRCAALNVHTYLRVRTLVYFDYRLDEPPAALVKKVYQWVFIRPVFLSSTC